MIIVFMGVQGSGKGTQAKILADKLNIPHVNTGGIFRSAQGELKEKIDSYINVGKLVPDELTIELIKKRISESDCKNGFILDGFPRNIEQAKALDKITKVDKVIEITLDDKEALRRLIGRRTCKSCKIDYNVNISELKPKKDELCDNCGEKLYKREDDTEEAIKQRIKIYHEETEPVIKHYSSVKIDGAPNIEKVSESIMDALNK